LKKLVSKKISAFLAVIPGLALSNPEIPGLKNGSGIGNPTCRGPRHGPLDRVHILQQTNRLFHTYA